MPVMTKRGTSNYRARGRAPRAIHRDLGPSHPPRLAGACRGARGGVDDLSMADRRAVRVRPGDEPADRDADARCLYRYPGDDADARSLRRYVDPGREALPNGRAIAGVVSGAGAVQGGAIEMMNFPPVGFQPALPLLALLHQSVRRSLMHCSAGSFSIRRCRPSSRSTSRRGPRSWSRSLARSGQDQSTFYGLAAVSFVAYNTAASFRRRSQSAKGIPVCCDRLSASQSGRLVALPASSRTSASSRSRIRTRRAATRRDPGATR